MSDIIPQDKALDVQQVGFNPPAFCVIPVQAFDQPQPCTGLDQALRQLGPGSFAVRRSARDEDGAQDSHAGQFDTVQNVPAAAV